MEIWDIFVRMVVALVLCGIIGFEREFSHKSAGFRTHILVGMGSALFVVCSIWISDAFPAKGVDPSRIAAQVVTGIGFLGAGAIMHSGFSVLGLTTAASLWMVAGVGMAAGMGFYPGAVIGTALSLLTLILLNYLDVFLRRYDFIQVSVNITADKDAFSKIEQEINRMRLMLSEYTLTEQGKDRGEVVVKIKDIPQSKAREFMDTLWEIPGVKRIEMV